MGLSYMGLEQCEVEEGKRKQGGDRWNRTLLTLAIDLGH
jgi:hypothetical protein